MLIDEYSPYKIVHNLDRMLALRGGEQTIPLKVQFAPTNRCNVKCAYCCYYGDSFTGFDLFDPQDEIPLERANRILDDCRDMKIPAVDFTGGGDPLCHPDIEFMLARCIKNGIKFGVITNGAHLDRNGLVELVARAAYIRLSLDARHGSTYSTLKGVHSDTFKRIVSTIEKLRAASSELVIGINFNVLRENYHEIHDAAEFYRGLGANNIRFAPVNVNWDGSKYGDASTEYYRDIKDHIRKLVDLAKAEFEAPAFAIFDVVTEKRLAGSWKREQDIPFCPHKELVTFIGADENVYTCCNQAYMPSGLVGSIKDRRLLEFWFSAEKRKFFERHDPRRQCRIPCVHQFKNEFMNYCLRHEPKHKEFI